MADSFYSFLLPFYVFNPGDSSPFCFSLLSLATLVPADFFFPAIHSCLYHSMILVISFVDTHCQPPHTPGSFIRIGLASSSFSFLSYLLCDYPRLLEHLVSLICP